MRIVDYLGYRRSAAEISDIVQGLRDSGNQNTRDRYSRFKGIPELEARLSDLPKLYLD